MKIINKFCLKLKILIYRNFLSRFKAVHGKPTIKQPVLFLGKGEIIFEEDVVIGYFPSPKFFSTYAHIEARDAKSKFSVGRGSLINNDFTAIAYNSCIKIGAKCLLGSNVEILSSDFHNIEPGDRWNSKVPPISKDVIIGDNVWVGNSAKILKGVNVGDNAVIAAGSIVVKDVPPNVIVAGNPAIEVKKL